MSGLSKSNRSSYSSSNSSTTQHKNKISFKQFMKKVMHPKTKVERLCFALMC